MRVASTAWLSLTMLIASLLMSFRVAIVGCGKIADGHAEEIAKFRDRATLVACCDRELLMAEQFSRRYRVPAHYERFEDLLENERPNVVHITTPPHSHLALGKQCIDSGAHVYVEKPVAPTRAAAQELFDHAIQKGKKVTVGYSSYFDPPMLALRALVAEGVIGEVLHVESYYGYNLAGPFGQALLADSSHWVHHLPGKLLHNVIDHLLNKMVEQIPDESPSVHAVGRVLRANRYGDARDELVDELRIVLSGKRVTGYGTFSAHIRPAGQFIHVYGSKNSAHVDLTARTVTLDTSATLPSAIGRLIPAFAQAGAFFREGSRNVLRFARNDFHFFAGLNRLIAAFYDCIDRDAEPPVAYRDVLRISGIMDEIFAQLTAQMRMS
jgi:predicted dehydrogenase